MPPAPAFTPDAELAEEAPVTYKHTWNERRVHRGWDAMKDKPSKSARIQKKTASSSAVGLKPRSFEGPIANVDELDLLVAPPLRGKTHPRRAMADVVPTADDEVRMSHHHPSDSASVEFESDPEAADAAADLASDLGADFLEAATRGRDFSDVLFEREQEGTDEFIIGEEERSGMEMREPSDFLQEPAGHPRGAKAPSPRRAKAAERSSASGRPARSRTR